MSMSSATHKSQSGTSPCNESVKLGSTRGIKQKEVSVSARTLAATLWEINKANSYALENKKSLRNADKNRKLVHQPDPLFGHVTEIENHSTGERGYGIRNRLKYVSTGLTASKELLKVVTRLLAVDEHPSSAMTLVSALRLELDRARFHVDQLLRDKESRFLDEFEHAMKLFEEEKAAWRKKEREKIRSGLAHIAEELEIEKKLRKQMERLNKKVGRELADTKASLSKVTKELENEKRAKNILEQVCDELANGIGEDRAVAEKIKRQSVKVRKEVEREREMLHMAHVLREERVQMKLSEAKYQFEEKTAVVEMLKNELETYLKKRQDDEEGDDSPGYDRIRELEAYLKEIKFGSCKGSLKEYNEGEFRSKEMVPDGDDSADSDLHSIELNMDNTSKSYKWSFVGDGGNTPLEKDIKGNRLITENIQWENMSHEREEPDASSIIEQQMKPDPSTREGFSGSVSRIQAESRNDENGMLESDEILNYGDSLLNESKFLSANYSGSPACQMQSIISATGTRQLTAILSSSPKT